jgi:peptidoglycan DL-endopeptidase CwlO
VASAAALAVVLPPAHADTLRQNTSLPTLVAEARQLSNQIDSLGQQVDGLRIQLAHARNEVKLAQQAYARDKGAVSTSQQQVAALAAQSYMQLGNDPTLQLLTGGNPQQFLSQAAAIQELGQNAGMRYTSLHTAQLAAERAATTAKQQIAAVTQLQAQVDKKTAQIQQKMNTINSAAMQQAMAIFEKTGSYPNYTLPMESTVGATALRNALTRQGDAYIWGAAGPSTFDCSGLVVWAFGQEGISLPHYTGDLWNSGMHVSRSDLEPGDLVFFFADISHVGIFLGNGLMVDAPTYGIPVGVHQIFWSNYVGAVRIA